jgi:hypothetical protein
MKEQKRSRAYTLRSNQTDPRPNQAASPIPHASTPMMCPIPLHPGERVLEMFRPQRCPGLGRCKKQRARRQWCILRIVVVVVSAISSSTFPPVQAHTGRFALSEERGGGRRGVINAQMRFLERSFDVQTCQGERANHLEREEADDVDRVVVGFQIQMRRQVQEISEPFC